MEMKIKFFACFVMISIILFSPSRYSFAKCPTRMGSVFLQDDFLVIAHRGSVTKFPENTFPAFHEALNVDGANSLEVDLSFTKDRKVVLWHDWDPDSPMALIRQAGLEPILKFKPSSPPSGQSRWRKKINELTLSEFRDHYGYEDKVTHVKSNATIPTFQDFIEWAGQQDKLKLVLLKFRVPADDIGLLTAMLEEIKGFIDSLDFQPRFQLIFSIPHKEALKMLKDRFNNVSFSFDREVPSVGAVNYHRFTTIPQAMKLKNGYAGIGLSVSPNPQSLQTQDPWTVYKFILTLDFRMRDSYRDSTSNYIKIISWTFNVEKKMRCLINLGVDGIVTDKPDLLRDLALDMGKKID